MNIWSSVHFTKEISNFFYFPFFWQLFINPDPVPSLVIDEKDMVYVLEELIVKTETYLINKMQYVTINAKCYNINKMPQLWFVKWESRG